MDGRTLIRKKQRFWAVRHAISVDENGYVGWLEANLFEPLSPEVSASFAAADGGELKSRGNGAPPKMHCVHSSSALAVNVFHYWRERDKSPLAKALQIPSHDLEHVHFERITPINGERFDRHPNIDVVLEYRGGEVREVGIESKLSEALGKHDGLSEKYLVYDALWEGIPAVRRVAESVRGPGKVEGLNTPQLLKHMLGLKARNGTTGFRLFYLWNGCDCPDSVAHAEQLRTLRRAFSQDGMCFQYMSYQELICRMAARLGPEHKRYLDYLAERYL